MLLEPAQLCVDKHKSESEQLRLEFVCAAFLSPLTSKLPDSTPPTHKSSKSAPSSSEPTTRLTPCWKPIPRSLTRKSRFRPRSHQSPASPRITYSVRQSSVTRCRSSNSSC